jgi:hypothetical protein
LIHTIAYVFGLGRGWNFPFVATLGLAPVLIPVLTGLQTALGFCALWGVTSTLQLASVWLVGRCGAKYKLFGSLVANEVSLRDLTANIARLTSGRPLS